jgi:hypothetical protein
MNNLIAPNGKKIHGTFESLQACAEIASAERNKDGGLELEYNGNTEIWWDSQRTIREKEERMFVDEEGNIWPESKLVLEGVDD